VAQGEVDKLQSRVRHGIAARKAEGKYTGGTVPFGYRLNMETRKLEPEPSESV